MKKRFFRLIACCAVISLMTTLASGMVHAAALSPKIEYISHTVFKPGSNGDQKIKVSWNSVKAKATVEILNKSKQPVKVLWTKKVTKRGSKVVKWDGTNQYKTRCPNGNYYIRFTLNNKKVLQPFKVNSKANAVDSGYGKAFLTYGTIGFPSGATVYATGDSFRAKDSKSSVLIESNIYSYKQYNMSDAKILECFTQSVIADWGIQGLKATNTKIMGIKAKQVSFTSKGKKFVDIYFAKNRRVYALEMNFSASNKKAAGVVSNVKKRIKINKTTKPKGGRTVIIDPGLFEVGELQLQIPKDYSLIKNGSNGWSIMAGNPFIRSGSAMYSVYSMYIDSVGVNTTQSTPREIIDEYLQNNSMLDYPGIVVENKDKQLNKGEMATSILSLNTDFMGMPLKYYESSSLIETETKHLYRVNIYEITEGKSKSYVDSFNNILDSITVK